MDSEQPVYHLIEADLWQAAVTRDEVYFPPSYEQDGFTHATAKTELLLQVANNFYQQVTGDWLCLQMTVASLEQSGVQVVFEGAASVGDQAAEFAGSAGELFPHILGGIHPSSVINVHAVTRSQDGAFLAIAGA